MVSRQQKETVYHIGSSLSIGDLKAHPHSDTLHPTRPYLLIVPLPMGQAFKHMSLCREGGKPIQTTTTVFKVIMPITEAHAKHPTCNFFAGFGIK